MDILQTQEFIRQKVVAREQVTPFLFVGDDPDNLELRVKNIAMNLMQEFEVDTHYYFEFLQKDEGNIKIEAIRDFMAQSSMKSSFRCQIFYIHDISRLTLASANAMLKFLEEPPEGNIIFLSSRSESGIIDTILSRVKIVSCNGGKQNIVDRQIYDMLELFYTQKNPKIFSHYYGLNPTKQDAKVFLYTLMQFLQNFSLLLEKTPEIVEDITGLERNNFSPKYIIDKYLFLL